MPPINKGNLITRRAFAETDRMKVLQRLVNKAMSTAYQMTEEVGEYGSGTPSPLHQVCELVRELLEIEQREGCQVSLSYEMAAYPLEFLRQLQNGAPKPESEMRLKLNFLIKSTSDANYQLRGRDLKDLSPNELKEFSRHLMDAATAARELSDMTDARLHAHEESYTATPIQRERTFKRAEG